jgi:S-formylglutathione hydrolase FrmB
MKPWSYELAGGFDEHVIESDALRGNPLGDPHQRPLWVYHPPGYEAESTRRYPSVYMIQGYTGQLDMWRNRMPFGTKTFPELTDELFAEGGAPPCIVVWVDAWTSIGGSQFLDSPAIGRYHTYLCDEVVPWVDARYRTLADRDHRAIAGKSSGGYGAMVTPLLRPDLFGALATHAGDALFEHCYLPDFREMRRVLRDHYEGSVERFWEDFRSRPGIVKPGDVEVISIWGMAAAYSADEDGTVRLPFDLETGELDPMVWERWLRWDPVRMARERPEAVRSLRAVYIDSGKSDEFYLDLGAEAFRRVCEQLGARDVFFELFEGKHGGITWRYPLALRYLAERLAPSRATVVAGAGTPPPDRLA